MVRSRIGLAMLSFIVFIVLAAAAPSMARDFCIERTGDQPPVEGTFVLKDFKFPKPGECVLFSGYMTPTALTSIPNALSGVACGGSGGDVTFGITTYSLETRLLDWISLRPEITATPNAEETVLPGDSSVSYFAASVECPPSTVP